MTWDKKLEEGRFEGQGCKVHVCLSVRVWQHEAEEGTDGSDGLQVQKSNQSVSRSVTLLTGSESLEESLPVEMRAQQMHIHKRSHQQGCALMWACDRDFFSYHNLGRRTECV